MEFNDNQHSRFYMLPPKTNQSQRVGKRLSLYCPAPQYDYSIDISKNKKEHLNVETKIIP
jgi:hypothetical protein